jgi:5'-AMP-activated protein kinase catalytic alpha subunit
VWSRGIILFVLLAGYLPFYDSDLMEMYRKTRQAKVYKNPHWFGDEVQKDRQSVRRQNNHQTP